VQSTLLNTESTIRRSRLLRKITVCPRRPSHSTLANTFSVREEYYYVTQNFIHIQSKQMFRRTTTNRSNERFCPQARSDRGSTGTKPIGTVTKQRMKVRVSATLLCAAWTWDAFSSSNAMHMPLAGKEELSIGFCSTQRRE
jgi:hypothetical protein